MHSESSDLSLKLSSFFFGHTFFLYTFSPVDLEQTNAGHETAEMNRVSNVALLDASLKGGRVCLPPNWASCSH